MAKGQSAIYEYIIFFAIGISLFISLCSIYLSQYTNLNKDISMSNARLMNSFLSANAVSIISQCRDCQTVTYTINVQKPGSTFIGVANDFGFNVLNPFIPLNYLSFAHNFASDTFFNGDSTLGKTITLTYNKDKNNLEIK